MPNTREYKNSTKEQKIPHSESESSDLGKKISVLVIDDDKWIQKVCQKILADNGFEGLEAVDPYTGLEIITEQKPNVVLLDLDLPKYKGSMILDVTKGMATTKDIKIIILSGVLNKSTIKAAHDLGAAGFIAKPFNEKIIVEKILETLDTDELEIIKNTGKIEDKYLP